jgi:hypothetical protein
MVRKINDPLFGLIELNNVESYILDTPIFQRLRRIKQLALANYVYPTATHDRFTHSLGVFHLTKEIAFELNKKSGGLLDEFSVKNLKMAALLHDIGHFPFSHALEFHSKQDDFPLDGFPSFLTFPHEEFGKYLIQNSYIKDILIDHSYDLNLICNLIEGKDIENLILNRIINWELDSDRLDYILRDSFFTGVGFGNINYHYLLSSFKPYQFKRIVLDSKAIRDIEQFIISRFSLHDRVYTHKTSSYFTYMLMVAGHDLISKSEFPSFQNQKELDEIISTEHDSMKFVEFSDFYILSKFFQEYIGLRNSMLDGKAKYLKKILEAVLFRKKFFKIKKYSIFTSKSESETDILKFRINSRLEKLKQIFPNELFIHTPKNAFTKYMATKIPPSGLSKDVEMKFKEEEEQTIWIQEKNNPPEIFYRSNETFLQKIHGFGITKVMIYLNKQNSLLIDEYESIEPEIKNIIYTE